MVAVFPEVGGLDGADEVTAANGGLMLSVAAGAVSKRSHNNNQ